MHPRPDAARVPQRMVARGSAVRDGGMVVRAMALPPRQCEIHAWARDFGLAHELGGYGRAYKAGRPSSRKGLGIFITGLGILPRIAVASPAAGQARPIILRD